MEHPDKDSDQNYLVLRSRKVPRPPAEYVDAHSVPRDSGSEVPKEEGAEEERGRREQERRATETETEGETQEESDVGGKMTYAEFVRDMQQRSQAMTTQSIRELCREMAAAFSGQAHEMERWTKLSMVYTIEREALIRELLEKGSSDPERRRGPFKEPMPFSGANPREWLLQMQQYYDLKGFSEELRLKDVPFHLTGDAHMFYYALVQHYPELYRRLWRTS